MSQVSAPKQIVLNKKPRAKRLTKSKLPTKEDLLQRLPPAIEELKKIIDGLQKEMEQCKVVQPPLFYIPEMVLDSLEQFEDQLEDMEDTLAELNSGSSAPVTIPNM